MSEAEEVVIASVRHFNAGDWNTLESMWDPDGTIVAPVAWPEGGERKGWAAIRGQFERLKSDWQEDHLTIEGVEEVQPGVVLTRFRWTVTGAASGVPLEVPMWMVATIRDGLYVRAEYFQEEAPARAAAEE